MPTFLILSSFGSEPIAGGVSKRKIQRKLITATIVYDSDGKVTKTTYVCGTPGKDCVLTGGVWVVK